MWLLCISAAAVAADDASGVLGSYFHEHFPDGLVRWKPCQVHKKLCGLTAACLREVPWEGRMQPVKSRLPHSRWKAFWGPRTNCEKCSCCWSLDLTEMPFPILYTPWYQLKWLPQLQGTELAWAETNPAQPNWFYDVQWGTQSNWPFCRGNLLAYPASSPPLPGKRYQALFVGPKTDSTASCSLWLALGWCQDEVRVLGHRANAVAVAVGSLPDAFSAHAHLPREFPLSVPYHTVPSFQFPICPQKHRLTHYCSFSAAPQLYQDPQRILR